MNGETEFVRLSVSGSSGWETCPADVLMAIFKQLDSRSLFNCMAVNHWWRDVVDFHAQHYNRWCDIAQEGILNKGLALRMKSVPEETSWRDLYFNSHLWRRVGAANVTWRYVENVEDICSMNLYKDYLIVTSRKECTHNLHQYDTEKETYLTRYFKIGVVLPQSIPATNGKSVDGPIAKAVRDDSSAINNGTLKDNKYFDHKQTDRMMTKLLQERPITKLAVFDDNSYYTLDEKNVMRRYVWDEESESWLNLVLGRYYGCSGRISDIYVFEGDVYMLLKTGYVMKVDREGRNFEKAYAFDFPPQSLTHFMRLLRCNLLKKIETMCLYELPDYCSNPNVMFEKFSLIISVPSDKEFKVNRYKDTDRVIIECPDLTSALEHGGILILGFKDGRVDICIPKKFIDSGGKPELSVNVRHNHKYQQENPAIVGLEVYESKESHHLFIATCSNIYRLVITYPECIKNSITVIRRED